MLLLVSALESCLLRSYKQPITGFQTASEHLIAVSRAYYLNANRVERNRLIDDRTATSEAIRGNELKDMSSQFRQSDVEVRLQALRFLRDFGTLLLRLAESDAPAQVSTEAAQLKASLQDVPAGTGSVHSALGAVGSVLQPALDELVRRKIMRGLDRSLSKSEVPVRELLEALRQDLSNLYERRRQAASLSLADATRTYNQAVQQKGSGAREQMLRRSQDLKLAAEEAEVVERSNPEAALTAMEKTYSKLLEFSRRKKTPQDRAELATAVQIFAATAQDLWEAAGELLGAKNG